MAKAGVSRRPSRLVFVLIGLGVLALLALWLVPLLQVEPARERLAVQTELTPAERLTLENQLFGAENAARATLAVLLAAAGLLVGAGIIWRRYEISRELKTHEQFAVAVEHLGSVRGDGSARTEARLGGIYALERLANESEQQYWPVVEVLTAYVRDNAPWSQNGALSVERTPPGAPPPRPAADIQAVLAVLGRRRVPATEGVEKRLLDLRATDLRGANLSGSRLDGVTLFAAHLDRADITGGVLGRSNLREASLVGASLTGVDLEGASLYKANLDGARLNGANLHGADLSGANLRGADLWEANLKGCNLKDADLRGADLSQCVLEEAILWRADLQGAVLTGARVKETHLERANLSGVTGLTWEQSEAAFTDENTVLPDYLQPQAMRALAGAVTPAPPTPAARRTRPAAAKPTPPASELSGPAKAPALAEEAAAPSPAEVPLSTEQPQAVDNVVQLNAPARRTRVRPPKPTAPDDEPDKPKKAALPKHRKPGLVKPA